MARAGEEFPLACPNYSGDFRLIRFIIDPTPIRMILADVGGRWSRRTCHRFEDRPSIGMTWCSHTAMGCMRGKGISVGKTTFLFPLFGFLRTAP